MQIREICKLIPLYFISYLTVKCYLQIEETMENFEKVGYFLWN